MDSSAEWVLPEDSLWGPNDPWQHTTPHGATPPGQASIHDPSAGSQWVGPQFQGTNTGAGSWGGQPSVSVTDARAVHPSAGIFSQSAQPNKHEKIMNDYPPIWDGKDPITKLEPYLKELDGWLHTTRTPPSFQGWVVFRAAKDELKTVLSDLTSEELKQVDSGKLVYNKIHETYSEFLGMEKQYAAKYEALLYETTSRRKNDESLLQYISRKKLLMRNLERIDKKLPEHFKGYCLLRDARLDVKSAEMLHNWTKGEMSFDVVEDHLKTRTPEPFGVYRRTNEGPCWCSFHG